MPAVGATCRKRVFLGVANPFCRSEGDSVIRKNLNSKTAWEVLVAADRFQLQDLRYDAFIAVAKDPKRTLEVRPSVSDILLEEVLDSNLMCISHSDLLDIFIEWKDVPDRLSRVDLICKYVSLDDLPDGKLASLSDKLRENDQECLRSYHAKPRHSQLSTDLLGYVKDCYNTWLNIKGQSNSTEQFLSWIQVTKSQNCTVTPGLVAHQAKDSKTAVSAGMWVECRVPHFDFHLLAIRFEAEVAEGTEITLLCGSDSSAMVEVFCSKAFASIVANTSVPCKCPFFVQRIKMKVNKGQFWTSNIKFEGMVCEAAPDPFAD